MRKSGCGGILSLFFVREVVDWCRRLAIDLNTGERVTEAEVAWESERLRRDLRACRVSMVAGWLGGDHGSGRRQGDGRREEAWEAWR